MFTLYYFVCSFCDFRFDRFDRFDTYSERLKNSMEILNVSVSTAVALRHLTET